MNCKYLSKSLNGKLRCKLLKKSILLSDCIKCLKNEPRVNKRIKQRSAKQNKLEKQRYSIFTDDLERCFNCGRKADDTHEVWGGSNRKRSIKYGLCIPLCRECHSNEKIVMKLRKSLQEVYIQRYGEQKFIEIIGKKVLENE